MSAAVAPGRYVDVTPAGVFGALAAPARTPGRDLIERLLWRDPRQPLDFEQMARQADQDVSGIARTMFALNRQHWVRVEPGVAGWPPAVPTGRLQQGLDDDLAALATDGARLVLACTEGYCLCRANTGREQAERIAAGGGQPPDLLPCLTLSFARDRITVFADRMPDCEHPAWVSLARRLLHACGAVSFGRFDH